MKRKYLRRFSRCSAICLVFLLAVAACGGDSGANNAQEDPASVGSDAAESPATSPASPGLPSPPVTDTGTNPPVTSNPEPMPPAPVTGNTEFRPSGYETVILNEEFTGRELDRSTWCTRMPWGGGPVLRFPDAQCEKFYGNGYGDYANITENQRFRDVDSAGQALHVVSDGTIKLRASNVADHWYTRYEAAGLRSKLVFKPSANKSYYITARMKLPDVLGTWPALFLIPSLEPFGKNQWPPEIDILEGPINGDVGTDRFTITQHTQIQSGQTDSGRSEWTYVAPGFNTEFGYYRSATNLRERWVEVGAEWAVSGVCYFVDGVKTACENYRWQHTVQDAGNPAALIAYLAVGGPWAGKNGIDDASFPAALEIDHIRIYEGNGALVSAPGTAVVAMGPEPGNDDPATARQQIPVADPNDDYKSLGYLPFFAEEFNGTQLDRTKWCTRLMYGGGAALEMPDEECTRFGQGSRDTANDIDLQRFRDTNTQGLALHEVSYGTLKLKATKTGNVPGAPYEAAALRSKLTVRAGDGSHYYVTARVKLPNVRGTWGAVSLLPSLEPDGQATWPPQISLLDAPLNNQTENAFTLIQKGHHNGPQTASGLPEWYYTGAGYNTALGYFVAANNLRDRWLEVGAEWTEKAVCFFVNGIPTACQGYEWRATDGVLANPASLIAYFSVGNPLAAKDGIDDAQLPAQMEIDWIRIYRRDGF